MNIRAKITAGAATALMAASAVAGLAPAARAVDCTAGCSNSSAITTTLTGSISLTTAPTASVTLTPPSGPVGSATGTDSMVVSANTPYNVTVTGLKANMTKYVSGAYVNSVTLATATAVTPVVVGVGVPTVLTGITTSAQKIVSSAGLVQDTVSLTFAQPIVVGDVPTTYRNDLTYTTSAGL